MDFDPRPLQIIQTPDLHDVERKEVKLQWLPKADHFIFEQTIPHLVVITNDGTSLTKRLQELFETKGYSVVILSFPSISQPTFKKEVKLASSDEAQIKTAIETITSLYGSIGSFIHLQPHVSYSLATFTHGFTQEKALVKTVFLLAKHLYTSLTAGHEQRAVFMTVTQMDGKLGLGNQADSSVMGGGFSGLVKCLNMEWPTVFCRALDTEPGLDVAQLANAIVEEYFDCHLGYTEIGISSGGRATLVAYSTRLQKQATIAVDMQKTDVFLVSGGGRGVTAGCIIKMAEKCKNRFILIGRSSIDFVIPAYALYETDELTLKTLIMNDLKQLGQKADLNMVKQRYNAIVAKKEVDETIAKIKAVGGEAVYLAADVTQLQAVQSQLNAIVEQWGPVSGIIHGAGVLADKLIQQKSADDFDKVVAVKLDGLQSMLQAVDWQQLRHIILFSSVAGFYGNRGQSDYAIANEVLNKWAYFIKRNHPLINVSSINWGAWEGGMVTPELKKLWLANGIRLVNPAGGTAMFVNELNNAYKDQVQIIIGDTLPMPESNTSGNLKEYTIGRNIRLDENPFLQHHCIQGNPVLPIVNAGAWMLDTCLHLYPGFRAYQIEDLRLFKGIVFNGQEKTDYFVKIQELEKSPDRVVCQVAVVSEGGKLPIKHYESKVKLRHFREVSLQNKQLLHDFALITPVMDGQQVYQNGALFHGAYFQGIEAVLKIDETQIVMKCNAKKVPREAQGQFAVDEVNTFFIDSQYQGLVLWVQHFYAGANSLPAKTDVSTLYKFIPFDKTLYVQISITENTPHRISANCVIVDEAGEIYSETEGASVTVAKDLRW